jgi:hypothetical protein
MACFAQRQLISGLEQHGCRVAVFLFAARCQRYFVANKLRRKQITHVTHVTADNISCDATEKARVHVTQHVGLLWPPVPVAAVVAVL